MTGQQLKNSILQMAVQGKLVPQDPNDEPASVLLERIRAEKEKLIKEGKIKKEKNPSVIFRGADNLPYEKIGKNEPVCIADEVPFEIPESWEWVRFKNLVSYSMGKTPPRKESEYWTEPVYPWVSIADMNADSTILSTKEMVNEYRSNTGLLLFGDVGTGKSFFAGCIANALLDRDVPVLMTNFPTILNRLTGMFSEDRADFIASFDEYDLLIIDDLGVERSTEYAMEQMFFVIDSRYRSRRPMIITTNLKLSELKNPPDLAHARIYDRILERCAPILFDGKNFREENAGATRQAAKDIVNSKHD